MTAITVAIRPAITPTVAPISLEQGYLTLSPAKQKLMAHNQQKIKTLLLKNLGSNLPSHVDMLTE